MLSVHVTMVGLRKCTISTSTNYISLLSFIMTELLIHAAFLLCTYCLYEEQNLILSLLTLKNVNEIHSQLCDNWTGICL